MICRSIEIAETEKKHRQESNKEFDFFYYLDEELNRIIKDA